MTWQILLTDPATGVQHELPNMISATGVWRLDDPASFDVTIDARDDILDHLTPHATDLVAIRDGTLTYRGKILDPSYNLGPNQQTVSIPSIDYRGLLDMVARIPAGGATYAGIDQAVIAWDLISDYQSRAGGARGITDGLGATSAQTRDRTYEEGAPIGRLIGDLGRVRNGFEWEIAPDLKLNRWHAPTRRGTTGIGTLDLGAMIAQATRPGRPQYANAWTVTGGDGTTPSTADDPGIAADPRGRWERSATYNTITQQSTLDDRAAWLLDEGNGRPEWALTMALGAWGGPGALWVGDTFELAISEPHIAVHDTYRVHEVVVTLDPSIERVALGVREE